MVFLPSYGNRTSNKPDHRKNAILKVGICADVHRDLVPDNEWRLQTFIDSMNERGDIDFIIQLGDFACPHDYNISFMDIWNSFKGPTYHVIGNHETDGGFTHNQVVDFLGAKGTYYSFDTNGYHFVVLSGNDKNPDKPSRGYPSYIGEEQRRWLADDLDKTNLPVIVFCHQSINEKLGPIEQANYIRLIFERTNEKAGFRKVRLIFNGHHHTDFYNIINDIHYVSINSMSYQWFGNPHQCKWYSKEMEEKYPVKNIIPYKDPLWAVMTIYADGEIAIDGRQSEFICPLPIEFVDHELMVPFISDRLLK